MTVFILACLVTPEHDVSGIGLRYGPHLAALSVGYVVFSYAAIPGVVVREFDVGYTAVGLLMSAALLAFVAVQAVGGRLVDDRATLPVLLGVVVANGVLAVVVDLAPTFEAMLALRALWGLTGGLTVTVCATHISRVHTGATATWHQSINGAMFTLGGAIAFVLTPQVVAVTGWLGVHAVAALVAAPAAVALWQDRHLSDRTRPPAARDAGDDRGPNWRAVVRNRVVLLAAVCNVATLGAYITLSTFVTAYFDDAGIVGPLNALALLVASTGRLGGGIAVLRPEIADGRVIAGASGVGVAALAALAAGVDAVGLVVALTLLALAAVSLPFGAIFKTTAGATPRDGTAVAVVVAAGNAAALVLPAVTGWIRDATGGYDAAFALLALANLAAVAAALSIARR
ncbi:MFS transporter [Natrononativus amylolyticus]|uniref:MFS transporter n=1 Tax=Natrononativus amylolyticus TaxID=2963434 RepID=UPI0020CBF567|nr:MFS transporter [Natrononativus amylolyticus]